MSRFASLLLAASLTTGLAAGTAFAQATKPQPTKPATTPAATQEDDTPSSAAQKRACDAKWKEEKAKTGAKGYKAYFTFMAKCLP